MMARNFTSTHTSVTIPETSHIMNKKRQSKTLTICLIPLLFFLSLDIILTLIFGSFERNPTGTQDFDTEENGKQKWESPEPTWSITCDRSHFEYDVCYINRPFILDPVTTTSFSVDPTNSTPSLVERILPYPRKWQHNAMESVKEVTLTTAPLYSPCAVTHTAPALVFSAGGFTSNVFHDFNEGFIPLFVTVNSFFNDQDVILAIVNCSDWWLNKYGKLIARFTHHAVINLDKETSTHCFPSAIVGLTSHGPMTVDPTLQRDPNPKTVIDFSAMLITTYSHGYAFPTQRRPKMVLMSRSHYRVILNQDKVLKVAEDVGFNVVEFEPTRETPMEEIFRVLHSSHVMVGVHGAGLTNELFLRPGSVLMQIVPIRLSWLGDICYGKLAIRLRLEYIVYDIAIEESSLANEHPKEMLDPNDQGGMLKSDWSNWNMYMNQNVTLNLARFKRYLERAYEKAKVLIQKESS
ncbi:protein O-GlcNAc transferase [Sarracenia purpurea var. burkii]